MEVARDGRRPLDVVLLDASLPGLDGFAVAERIAAEPALARRAVVQLSTAQLATGAERALALGAAYLTTPVTAAPLSELLTALVSGQPLPGHSTAGPRLARRPLRVLVVDDHLVNQAVASATLRKWGHAVASAADGQEAVDRTARESFDVVLMDLQMPVMDGLEATRRIRAREQADGRPRVPIIAMTARAMAEDRDRCAAAGMDGYLSKPMNAQQFFDVLESIGRTAPPALSMLTPLIADRDTGRHVAEVFVSTVPGQMDRLRKAIGDKDPLVTASVAHAIRGAMSHFSGASVSALERLEEDALASSLDNAPQLLKDVERQIHALLDRLRQLLA
jgi:CheY-like chemotaxis protein